MAYGRVAKFEPVREVAFGAIGAAYSAVGTLTTVAITSKKIGFQA